MADKRYSGEALGPRGERERYSRVIRALDLLKEDLSQSVPSPPSGLFGARAVLRAGGSVIDLANLDLEFTVPFDDDTTANEAEFTVYNLSRATRERLELDKAVTLTAGYGDDTGVIFSGVISDVKSPWVGVDRKTVISAVDNPALKEKDVENISFSAGTSASYILRALLERLGLPIAVFRARKDHIYEDAVTVSGGLMQSIDRYARTCGISTYIQRGKIYAQDVRESTNGLRFDLDSSHGLLESPEPFQEELKEDGETEIRKGYRLKLLLQHRAMTGSLVNLRTRDVTGAFHVLEGKHVYNGTDFITELTVI